MNNELIDRIDTALTAISVEEEAFASVCSSVAHIAEDIAARKALLLDCKAALIHMSEDLEAVVAKHASLSIALSQQQEAKPVCVWTDKLTDSLHDLVLFTPGGVAPSWGRINDVVMENVPAAISPPKPAAQPQVPDGWGNTAKSAIEFATKESVTLFPDTACAHIKGLARLVISLSAAKEEGKDV